MAKINKLFKTYDASYVAPMKWTLRILGITLLVAIYEYLDTRYRFNYIIGADNSTVLRNVVVFEKVISMYFFMITSIAMIAILPVLKYMNYVSYIKKITGLKTMQEIDQYIREASEVFGVVEPLIKEDICKLNNRLKKIIYIQVCYSIYHEENKIIKKYLSFYQHLRRAF